MAALPCAFAYALRGRAFDKMLHRKPVCMSLCVCVCSQQLNGNKLYVNEIPRNWSVDDRGPDMVQRGLRIFANLRA